MTKDNFHSHLSANTMPMEKMHRAGLFSIISKIHHGKP